MNLKNIPILYIFLTISALSLILTLLLIGIGIHFFVLLVLWILIYLIHFKKVVNIPFLLTINIWILISVVIFSNLLFLTVLKPQKNTTSVQPLTADECAPIYEEFNNTVLDISSDGLKGTVGIQINEEDCKADVNYNLIYTLELPKNSPLTGMNINGYKYVGGLRANGEERKLNSGTGEIFPVFTNKDLLPNEFDFGLQDIEYSSNEQMNGASTSTFYQGWRSMYNFREDSLERIISKDIYQVMDASNYIVKETIEEVTSESIDTGKASVEGDIVKTYELTYTIR